MAGTRWRKVALSEHEQNIVKQDRLTHHNPRVRIKLDVIWHLHSGCSQKQTAQITGVSLRTIARYLDDFADGGIEKLTRWKWNTQPSELARHEADIRDHFQKHPPKDIAEASHAIFKLTGVKRKETVTREFLNKLGMSWKRTSPIPVPPKKS